MQKLDFSHKIFNGNLLTKIILSDFGQKKNNLPYFWKLDE